MEQMEGGEAERRDAELWRKRMGEKGWGAPTWPKDYGGGGLSPAEARVLQQEMDRIGARNPIGGMGAGMFGPTLLEYGTRSRSRRTSRRSAAASCAGARATPSRAPAPTSPRLQTKAEDKGDHWLVNGQKIWTSRRPVRRLVLLPGAHRPQPRSTKASASC